MYFATFAASCLFVASVLAVAQPAPYLTPDFSVNPAFGLKRQSNGYAPTHGPSCTGGGRTCESACGPTYLQCPSNDGRKHCFDTAKKQSCCSDGNGYACAAGYYCTNTVSKRTWCCPDGMNLDQCAAAYSLTEKLQSVTTAQVSSSDTASVPSATVSTTRSTSGGASTDSSISRTSPGASSTSLVPVSPAVPSKPIGSATSLITPTATTQALFTGAAVLNAGVIGGGFPAMALAVGALFW